MDKGRDKWLFRDTSDRVPIASEYARSKGACRQRRGSALTEFVILIIVMIPLFLAIPMIGNLVDLKQSAVQASRYAAWEATVANGEGAYSSEPAEIKTRFFGQYDNIISSSGSDGGNNQLWGDTAVDARWADQYSIRIDDSSVTAIPYSSVTSHSIALKVGQQIEKAGKMLGSVSGGKWDLPGDGLTRAGVSLNIRSNSWLSRSSSVQCGGIDTFGCLDDTAVILVDGWSAGSDDQSKERVRALVPAGALESIGDAISLAGNIPLFPELKKLKNAFGHVDMTVLPASALQRYSE